MVESRTYLNQQIKKLLENRFEVYLYDGLDGEFQLGADEIERLVRSQDKP